MRRVLDSIRLLLNDPQFIAEHRYCAADFSRQRTLAFERVALSFLSGPVTSLHHGVEALCQGLNRPEEGPPVTKQALSKAYRKFPTRP